MEADHIQRVYDRTAAFEETVTSDDGLVDVTVGVRGELRSLRLDPRIYRDPDADALAASIVRAVRNATDAVDRRAFREMTDLLPPRARFEDTDLAFDPMLTALDRMLENGG